MEEGAKRRVPATVMLAVVMHETRCSSKIGYPRTGCDVGIGQIHIRDCESPEVGRMLDRRRNLAAMARILSWSRSICTGRLIGAPPCKETVWAAYNWRSPNWRRRVKILIRRIEDGVRGVPQT
jgi:hypothetical protein